MSKANRCLLVVYLIQKIAFTFSEIVLLSVYLVLSVKAGYNDCFVHSQISLV